MLFLRYFLVMSYEFMICLNFLTSIPAGGFFLNWFLTSKTKNLLNVPGSLCDIALLYSRRFNGDFITFLNLKIAETCLIQSDCFMNITFKKEFLIFKISPSNLRINLLTCLP